MAFPSIYIRFAAPDGVYSYLVKYKELGYVNKFQVTGSVVVIR